MSRCIVIILCLALTPTVALFSEKSAYELGIRTGIGQRVPGRLDGNLNGFTSTFNALIPSEITLSSSNQTGTIEFFGKTNLGSGQKFGIILGRQDLAPIQLTEITGDLFFTTLKSDIYSYHALFAYYFVTPFARHWEWENGLGFGPTITDWVIRGSSGSFGTNRNFFPQEGDLRGVGLAMRGESSLTRQILEKTHLQLTLGYHFITVPQFSGNYNGEQSSIYIGESGRIGVLDETRVTDASFQTNQFLRRFDIATGTWNLYFSVVQRFLD